jgi:hypothetical protein
LAAVTALFRTGQVQTVAQQVEQRHARILQGDGVRHAIDEADPAEALHHWLRSNVEFVATKKGMATALALAAHRPSELIAFSFDRLSKAVGALLDRAVAAGRIRGDIRPEDLLRTLVGMCLLNDQPGWQDSVLRMVEVFVDGMRVRPSSP